MLDITKTPFPITYRELWLPRAINGNATLPSSRHNGHPLTLTGARKGTTADGVHFTGANTSNINCGAIHDNAATLWLKKRFKFDQAYAAGSGDQCLWGKFVDATHFLRLVFKTADGKLYFEGQDGGVNDFSIAAQDGAADITAWNAGQWYTVLASISAANNVRFIVDDGTVVADASAIAAPNGGDFIIGDYDDPGAGTGFEGIIADVVVGTDDLSQAAPDEEYDLYAGIPPADAVNEWLLDEGRGVTVYDRGSGGNNGTLDTTATWAFGQVQQPVISLDGINDRAISSIGVDINGGYTLVWVAKMKSTYDTLSSIDRMYAIYNATTWFSLFYYDVSNSIALQLWDVTLGGAWLYYTPSHNIDDYLIFIGTKTPSGECKLLVNGSLVDSNVGAPSSIAMAHTAYIGVWSDLTGNDISKPLFVALIDGALTDKQILAYSRYLKNVFNLPLTI